MLTSLCYYARISEIFEYLGSGLKVPTEINGLYSLSMPLCTRAEIFENLISMLNLCLVYAIMLA